MSLVAVVILLQYILIMWKYFDLFLVQHDFVFFLDMSITASSILSDRKAS